MRWVNWERYTAAMRITLSSLLSLLMMSALLGGLLRALRCRHDNVVVIPRHSDRDGSANALPHAPRQERAPSAGYRPFCASA